jgi:hypothetical protein
MAIHRRGVAVDRQTSFIIEKQRPGDQGVSWAADQGGIGGIRPERIRSHAPSQSDLKATQCRSERYA